MNAKILPALRSSRQRFFARKNILKNENKNVNLQKKYDEYNFIYKRKQHGKPFAF